MADYAALLNAERKKTTPSPTKDVQQVQKPYVSPVPNQPETEKNASPQDPKGSRVQDSFTPSIQEVKNKRSQDSMTSSTLDPKIPRPQGVKSPRVIKTHSYEFYIDQVVRIRDMAYEDKKKGGKGS